jgi:hypothetical protein
MPLKIARHDVTQGDFVDGAFSPVTVTYPDSPSTTKTVFTGGVGGGPLNTINSATDMTIACSFVDRNGITWTDGFITQQKGEYQFMVQSVAGNSTSTTRCVLVATQTSSLIAGQMNIAAVDTTGNLFFARKIDSKFVWNNGKQPYVLGTDTAIQYIASQGGVTFTAANGSTVGPYAVVSSNNYYNPNANYPIPGSGAYLTAATAFSGMTYSLMGSTATVTGGVATIPNQAAGLVRTKYVGNWDGTSPGNSTSTWNMNFFSTATFTAQVVESYISWGNQTDTAQQQNFSCTFYGYFQVPTTQNYNIYASVDDEVAVWIGSSALAPTTTNWVMHGSNQSMPGGSAVGPNTVALTAGVWYPITIYQSEYQGGTKMQLFFQGANGSNYAGTDLQWAHNKVTRGF